MEKDLLTMIRTAPEEDLQKILDAVVARYGQLFPEWEITVLSLEKGERRQDQLDQLIGVLTKMRNMP